MTSGGITNASIRAALLGLLGRPIEESRALVIPTAQWGHPMCSPESVWRTVAGRWGGEAGFVGLGWKSVGVLELLALPAMSEERWMPWVREADVLLVDGGEAVYLAHWLRESGLAALLPSLSDTVRVGVSAGSMVLTPRIGPEFVEWRPDAGDETLGLVGFSIFPHLGYPGWSSNTTGSVRRWAARIGGPSYAIDDQTALALDGGEVRVISEGRGSRSLRQPEMGRAPRVTARCPLVPPLGGMSVSLRVGPIAYPIGRADFLGSFFETVAVRLEGGSRGSRFPTLAALYRDGELSPDAAGAARDELERAEHELCQHPPTAVVWDIDRPGVLPPWGSDIADTITSLDNYFVTADGRSLIAVMDSAFDASARTGKPVRIVCVAN